MKRKNRRKKEHGMQMGSSGYGITHGCKGKHGIGIQHSYGPGDVKEDNRHEYHGCGYKR